MTLTYSTTAVPSRKDILAGREDIDDRAIIRERRARIGRGSRADGADLRLAGGRARGGVGVAVTRGDGDEDAGADHGARGAVDGRRRSPAQGHVGHGPLRTAARRHVRRHVVHPRYHTRRRARAGGVEDFDGV